MQVNTENILSINKRIIQFIDYLNVSRYKFSHNTGVSESVLLNIYKGKNKPSVDFLEKILDIYPALNSNWLLTGNGEMIIIDKPVVEGASTTFKPPGICEMCREKDDRIKVLNKLVSTMQQNMDLLNARIKDLEGRESGQKRKAG